MTLEVIMVAGEIPNGSKVRKITGSYIYTLLHKMLIYGGPPPFKEIKPDPNLKFMLSEDGAINVIADTKNLVWIVEMEDLSNYLDEQLRDEA